MVQLGPDAPGRTVVVAVLVRVAGDLLCSFGKFIFAVNRLVGWLFSGVVTEFHIYVKNEFKGWAGCNSKAD